MPLSDKQINNITVRVRHDMSLMNTENKRKFDKQKFENFVEQFACLDNGEVAEFINELYEQQFISLEKACVDNYDYILISGLGNLKTNYARQEILKLVNDGNTTYQKDIQHILDDYIEMKEANNKIVQVDIKLSFNEKDPSQK